MSAKRGRGRPLGSRGRCSFCLELGHYVRDGACSAVVIALRRVADDGLTVREAAAELGISRQAVYKRRRNLRARGEQ